MKGYFSLLLLIFILLCAGCYALEHYRPEFNFYALIAGNATMLLLSAVTYAIVKKQLNKSPQAFVRSVSVASFIKLLICAAAAIVYIYINRKDFDRPSLFMLCGIYLLYTITETFFLSKLARVTK